MTQSNVVVTGPNAAEGTYKNIVLKSGIGFEEQTREGYCIYHVKWDYDLGGAVVDIPANVVISMEGGVISNGTLVGHDTQIIYDVPVDKAFVNVELEGTWIDDDDKQDARITELERISGNRAESTVLPTHMGRITLKPNIAKRSNYWFVYPYTYTSFGTEVTANILVYFNNNKYYLPRSFQDTTPVALTVIAQDIVGELPFSSGANIEDVATALDLQSGQYLSYDPRTKIITMPDSSTVDANDVVNDNWPLKNYTETDANLLTQQMISKPNTIYVIQYDYELATDITVPANCVLEFDGGSISDGIIVGSNTTIKANNAIIFNKIDFNGSWLISNIYSNWFADILSANKLRLLTKLCNNDIHNNIFVDSDSENYKLQLTNGPIADIGWDIVNMNDLTVYINGNIQLLTNNVPNYSIIRIYYCKNVEIAGKGILIGDKDTHDYTTHQSEYATHEWGHGINVIASQNVKISGITVKETTGDGFYLDYGFLESDVCSDIILDNITSYGIRRNGITVATVNNVHISNFTCVYNGLVLNTIHDGIDIEPNSGTVENINISGVKCYKALNGISLNGDNSTMRMVEITNAYFEDVETALLHLRFCNNVRISNIEVGKSSSSVPNCYYAFQAANTTNVIFENAKLDAYTIAFLVEGGDANIKNIKVVSSSILFGLGNDNNAIVIADSIIAHCGYLIGSGTSTDAKYTFNNINTEIESDSLYANLYIENSSLRFLYSNCNLKGCTLYNTKILVPSLSYKINVSGAHIHDYQRFISYGQYGFQTLEGVPAKGTSKIEKGTLCISDGTKWINSDGIDMTSVDKPLVGTTTDRQSLSLGIANAGLKFYDKTLGKPMYWDGENWKDAVGNVES